MKHYMDKIDENYIQRRINDSRKNWYIYFYNDAGGKYIGIIKADDDREAYIKFFDEFNGINTTILIHKNKYNAIRKKCRKSNYTNIMHRCINRLDNECDNELNNILSSILFSKNKKKQHMFNDIKYEQIKDLANDRSYHPYRIKFHIQKY